jgi:hypothetical protein
METSGPPAVLRDKNHKILQLVNIWSWPRSQCSESRSKLPPYLNNAVALSLMQALEHDYPGLLHFAKENLLWSLRIIQLGGYWIETVHTKQNNKAISEHGNIKGVFH